MEREIQRRLLVETGGPLFGFQSEGEAVVVGAGGPGPKARHRPRSFRPDRDAVDRAIARVHEISEGRYRYVGSWHTHPLGRAHPSRTDAAAARQISQETDVALPRPLLLIHRTIPTRRTFRDRDLRAFWWNPSVMDLDPVPLRVLSSGERNHPLLDLDWDAVVV